MSDPAPPAKDAAPPKDVKKGIPLPMIIGGVLLAWFVVESNLIARLFDQLGHGLFLSKMFGGPLLILIAVILYLRNSKK